MEYLLLGLSVIITLAAQTYISTTYSKYSQVKSNNNLTGAEVARKILDNNGLNNIEVVEVRGYLSDHYDPTKKLVALSSNNFNSSSIAGVSVAAHECGHAIQDKENYSFMRLRASLVPIVNLSSYAGYIAIVLGIIMGALNFIWIGIALEVVILLFQLITLPVEFDASKKALREVEKYNILNNQEIKAGKTVLTSAALTYVASVATTLIEILRLIVVFGNRRDYHAIQ